jgi:hypothetical protein
LIKSRINKIKIATEKRCYYTNGKPTVKLSPPARQQLWHVSTGFLEAGKVLSNITSEELQTIIDEEHIKAFGITREERQLKQKLAAEDVEQDWDKYDLPPKMR